MSEIRFYLDENIGKEIAKGCRTQKIAVLTTTEAGHMGWKDEAHLAFALEQRYVLVTQDDDFLTLARTIGHAGIAYYKPQTRTVKQILNGLFALHANVSQEDMQNTIRFL